MMSRSAAVEQPKAGFSQETWALIVAWGFFLIVQIPKSLHIEILPLLAFSLLCAGVIMFGAKGVMSHAEALAHRLGEPFGTLILTLSAITIEVVLVASVMLQEGSSPGVGRDTMMATLMVIMNGLVGLALLIGGLRHRQQVFNLESARSFLAVLIPLAVCALILPTYTVSTDGPTLMAEQAVAFGLLTLSMYGVFVVMQTTRYTNFFRDSESEAAEAAAPHHAPRSDVPGVGRSALMLVLTLLPVALLSHEFAVKLEHNHPAWMTDALIGVIIAVLVMTPEGMSAITAAWHNQMQRAVNILLGSALSTVGLTVPVVIVIGLASGKPFFLGLDSNYALMLVLSLVVASITFGGARTDMLKGFVHILMFLVFLVLTFIP